MIPYRSGREIRGRIFRRKPRVEQGRDAPARDADVISPGPAVVEAFEIAPGQPEPVGWALSPPVPSVAPAVVVDLEPMPEWSRASPSSGNGQPGGADALESAPHKPTLAERLRAMMSLPFELLLPGPDTILEWPGSLMPFQVEGVQELITRDRMLLADDMGLGKTIQAIAAVRILFLQRAIESALIVVPASLLDQWRRELDKWAPELRAIILRGTPTERAWMWDARVHVTFISYETLRSDFTGNLHSPPRRKIWDLVALDEAQRIKNRNDTSDAVKQLQRKRSWALTGTPLENDVDDLASILEFVDQGELTSTRSYHPGPQLLGRHRELQLRRKKVDVLDQLPPKSVTKIPISLTSKQQASYDRAEREGVVHLRELGRGVRVQHVLELLTRLKQICNADPATGESAKLEDIRERLSILSQGGNRAIIFSQYVDKVFGVGAAAEAIDDFKPLTFTGDMSSQERDRVIQRFKANDTHKALVLSLKAGGTGLNLQEASYVFHLDRWWNPAIERQAEDRSHRYGQVVPVNVFKYTCIGTIEERIDKILEEKQRLFDGLIDDVSFDVGTRLTSEELFGIFGLEAPPPSIHR